MHSVQVNLRERQGFIIHPFTVPISTSAAQLTVEHDGYVVEPAFDFKQRAGYISVAKDHRNKYALRGSYAFREVRASLSASELSPQHAVGCVACHAALMLLRLSPHSACQNSVRLSVKFHLFLSAGDRPLRGRVQEPQPT